MRQEVLLGIPRPEVIDFRFSPLREALIPSPLDPPFPGRGDRMKGVFGRLCRPKTPFFRWGGVVLIGLCASMSIDNEEASDKIVS